MKGISSYAKAMLTDMPERLEALREIALEPDGPTKYADTLAADLELFEGLDELSDFESLREFCEKIEASMKGLTAIRNFTGDSRKKDAVSGGRNALKKEIKDLRERYFSMPLDELGDEDIAAFFSIGFTHHREIIRYCKDIDERLYYIRACAKGFWSVIELKNHIAADEYRHIGILANNFEKTLSPMALATHAVRSFKDEYLLDLINLDNVDARYGYETDERVLSKSMVANIEKTIQALGGNDFCFMGREKRLVFEDEEFFVDLLFFHRGLKAMVAIELKMGDFHPGYLGQLNFYLSALDKLMKKPDENPTIGLLLCEKVKKPVVELAVQGYSKPIGIATYQALRNIPEPYKTLAPVIDGVRKVMIESKRDEAKSRKRKEGARK
jgi:predicted nuclease of restriction endonuclease-like (RecB) superfamily